METTWNPVVEHIEGTLCEKGLMKEHFDFEKDELVRKLTPDGKLTAENLLKDPKWRAAYLKLANEQFSKFPLSTRKILWKQIANQLKEIKKR